MTVVLQDRGDMTLANYHRVAWRGETVQIGEVALGRMAESRQALLRMLESDPDIVVYGTTSGAGDRARVILTLEEREAQGKQIWRRGWTWGESWPVRVVRGILFARLTNWLEGNGAVRPELARAVAGMLDGRPLPPVPMFGNFGSGEITALPHLLGGVGELVGGTEIKEPMELINGSPCAASLVADCALRGRRLLGLAHLVFALSSEAILAPLEQFDEALEDLWGDEHETEALRTARFLLAGGAAQRRSYQAPVSWRVLPRMLGQAHRAVALAEQAAETSLRSVTDNPVYLPPDADHPRGRAFSTGGYHNAMAYPAIDALASSWADLAQLCERQVERFFSPMEQGELTALPLSYMVAVAFAEDAREAAQVTLVGLGGLGQNDTSSPTPAAWGKAQRVAKAFESALTVLAAVSSYAFDVAGRTATPATEPFLSEVRERFPTGLDRNEQGDAAASLNEFFTSCSYSDRFAGTGS